jgi:hypothetical protein
MSTAESREQSIAAHVRSLSEESAELLREQVRLIREDLTTEVRRLGVAGGLLAGAGLLGVGAFGAATAGLVGALGARTGPGRAGFVVALLYGGAAGALAVAAREELRRSAAEAADTLNRDVQAAADGARQSG